MFIAIVFILTLYYLEETVHLDQKKFDVNTITASDYTVELDITTAMWNNFLKHHYDPIGKE